jgi:hypothetical protein
MPIFLHNKYVYMETCTCEFCIEERKEREAERIEQEKECERQEEENEKFRVRCTNCKNPANPKGIICRLVTSLHQHKLTWGECDVELQIWQCPECKDIYIKEFS